MKAAPLILAATLLGNVALVGVVLVRQSAAPAKTSGANSIAPSPSPALAAPDGSRTLAQLCASDDTQALIQYLRENNIPPDIIRSVARARLDKEFAPRRAALEDPPRPYWRRNSKLPQSKPDPNRLPEKLALETEYQAALKDLTAGLPLDRSASVRREFGDLPDAKITQLQAINKDYADLRSKLRADMQGVTLPGDQAQLALLAKEQRADLAKVLTPDELRDYDLRSSPLAAQIQTQIQFFNATESEYTALYDAQATVDDQTAGQNLPADELARLRDAAAQAALSPERYAEYKIATSDSYRNVRNLADRLNLPKTTIAQVITTQNETTAQAAQIRNDTTLAPADRDAQLATLAQNARQQLTTALGKQGMKQYQDLPDSDWLKQLKPKPPQQ